MTPDLSNICSHLRAKLEEGGEYHDLYVEMQADPDVEMVVRQRQLHCYRHNEYGRRYKFLILKGKADPVYLAAPEPICCLYGPPPMEWENLQE